MANVTQDRLKELVHYDPVSGIFTRIKDVAGNAKAGDQLRSTNSHGYLQARIDGKYYVLHRLAFLYMNGAMPDVDVDHINRDRSDNRWGNLREATRSQNLRNAGAYKANKSGYRGVSLKKKTNKWVAQISLDKKLHHLGYYETAEDAHAAYLEAAKKHAGEFAAAA
jgi:hypothetical protein